MKKIYTGICIAFLIGILCSCGGAKDILLQTKDYSGQCHVLFGNSAYDLTLEIGEGANLTAVFSSPSAFEGLKFCFAGEEFTLYYKEIIWRGNSENFPTTSIVTAMRNAFIEVSRSASRPHKTSDGLYIVQGNSPSGDFKFSFNPDGSPHGLAMDEIGLQVEFITVT